jgi:hypothetical protein
VIRCGAILAVLLVTGCAAQVVLRDGKVANVSFSVPEIADEIPDDVLKDGN